MSELSLFDLAGKRALVTGAAVGAGRACATALAQAGARVAVIDVNDDIGRRTADVLARYGSDSHFLHCDVTDEAQIERTVAAVVQRFGRLDIAVNSAGIASTEPDLELSKTDWQRVLDVNLTGLWLCARSQARHMARQSPMGGKIINVGSMWGTMAGSTGSYCASKAGVIHLSKTLAVEWGGYNINVNSLSPGWMMTPLMLRSLQAPEEFCRRAREITPLGHLPRPEDLAGAVIFLASRASDAVTGLDLIVDCGHTLNTWFSPMSRHAPPRISPEEERSHLDEDLAAMRDAAADLTSPK